MTRRRDELAHFGNRLVWLSAADAACVHGRALCFTSALHNGLDPAAVTSIEHLDVDGADADPDTWLSRRIGSGSVLVIFDAHQVCRMDSRFFVENWQDIFCPSRDDAVILVENGNGVLFYCHEDEFEFGRRETSK